MLLSSASPPLAGRYQLQQRICAGSAGEVWQGTDTLLTRPVAIKLLKERYACDPRTVRRFRGEAHNAGTLSHECIAHVYDYGEPEPPQPPFLVMELVAGPSLDEIIAGGPASLARTLDIVARVAAGLDAAHSAGLVHRDIKPGNILVGRDGCVKIADFGIARAACSEPLTDTGMLVGTAAYLAPERVAGGPATPASDLYSLGVVAYQCLTGTLPFAGSLMEMALAHRECQFPPLPAGIPDAVSELIRELTAKDPAARPAGAAEVACRAARLRAQLTRGTPAGQALSQAAVPQPRVPQPYVSFSEAYSEPRAIPSPARPLPVRRRSWQVAAAVAGVTIFAVAGLTVASQGAAAPAGRSSPPVPARPARPALNTVTMIRVRATASAGQPAAAVLRYLRAHDLVPRLRWQASAAQPPGTVLAVWPGGRVPAGTHITVTVAVRPPAMASRHDKPAHPGQGPPPRAGTAPGHGPGGGGPGKAKGKGKGPDKAKGPGGAEHGRAGGA